MAPRSHRGRKLLVASLGVATLNYAGCGSTIVGNPGDASARDASTDEASDSPFGSASETAADGPSVDVSIGDAGVVEELPVANLAVP
jgi:hypothetical protein